MAWLNAAALLALFAGHCELNAAWINRVHGLPWRRRRLRTLRAVGEVLIAAFPPLVLWRVGLTGPRLLTGGSWSDLPVWWAADFALCGLGFLSLCVCAWRYSTGTRPEVTQTETVDVAALLGHAPAGPGRGGRIARLPGNEVFHLEVNEKRLHLPGLPSELEGLSIAHLTDAHLRGPVGKEFFISACERAAAFGADLIAFTGDLIDEPECLNWLPDTFGRLSAPLGCWFILGNHDWLTGPEPIRRAMTDLGWKSLGSRAVAVEHRGRRILLAGDETPWLGTAPDPDAAGPCDLRVMLGHTPDVFPRAASQGFDLMLAGHNHGGQVRLPVIGPVFSPSRTGIRYASGTFRQGHSVLHVSRGMSGERPLRWRCPPEITRLVLARNG